MMKKQVVSEYRKFRAIGERAEHALRSAKILVAFRNLEEKGKARIVAEPEDDNYFDVFGEPETQKERDEICRIIERDSIWYVKAEKLCCKKCGTFETKDGIGMCIYNDPTSPYENSYVIDLMASCLS